MAGSIVLCARRMRACYTMTSVLSVPPFFFVPCYHVLEMQKAAAESFTR